MQCPDAPAARPDETGPLEPSKSIRLGAPGDRMSDESCNQFVLSLAPPQDVHARPSSRSTCSSGIPGTPAAVHAWPPRPRDAPPRSPARRRGRVPPATMATASDGRLHRSRMPGKSSRASVRSAWGSVVLDPPSVAAISFRHSSPGVPETAIIADLSVVSEPAQTRRSPAEPIRLSATPQRLPSRRRLRGSGVVCEVRLPDGVSSARNS